MSTPCHVSPSPLIVFFYLLIPPQNTVVHEWTHLSFWRFFSCVSFQVIDSGLDETSCFFLDDDGEEIEHGYYFEELAMASSGTAAVIFKGGDFPVDLTRRKVSKSTIYNIYGVRRHQ